VMQHLEYCHQVRWPDLDVAMVSVTEQWAQYAVAGPRSREVLQKLFGDAADLSDASFPYMGVGEFHLGAVPARVFRLSFSGELAYEIAVPARYGASLIEALMAAGHEFGIVPYGTEALGVMRIEKGHVAGNELNGQTIAGDLGLGRMMSKKKDYIGRVMAGRPALVDPDRPTLVGFQAVDPAVRLRAGAHFVAVGATPSPQTDEGYMTSVAFSPNLNRWIGLGLLKRGPERIGQRMRAYDPIRNGDIELEIVSPVFIDPEGTRLHG
jgi:glycine cleavage system aminomethyltransferase T